MVALLSIRLSLGLITTSKPALGVYLAAGISRDRMASISPDPSDRESTFQVIPLGGLGEFGMNMLLIVHNETALLIDAGSMFPGPELPGVDRVIPDLEHLKKRVGRLDAVVLTHGHEDHVADAESIAKRTGATIVSNFEIVSWFGSKGISNGHPMNHGGSWSFDFGTVKYVNAVHSSVLPDGSYGGNPGGFIIKMDGKTVPSYSLPLGGVCDGIKDKTKNIFGLYLDT